jgi:hypothetical protein
LQQVSVVKLNVGARPWVQTRGGNGVVWIPPDASSAGWVPCACPGCWIRTLCYVVHRVSNRWSASVMFGAKVTGGWRKLHTEELHISYSSPDIIRKITLTRMR